MQLFTYFVLINTINIGILFINNYNVKLSLSLLIYSSIFSEGIIWSGSGGMRSNLFVCEEFF